MIIIPCHSTLFLLFLEYEKKRKERNKIKKVWVKNKKTLYKRLEWRKNKSTILASDSPWENDKKKMRKSLLLYEILTDHTWENNKI